MNPTTEQLGEQLGTALAREMRHGWRDGEGPGADSFFTRHPELLDQPEAAVELIYEEYCLRQAAGQHAVEQDIVHRFPQWADALRVMLDCHRHLLRSDRQRPHFPVVGDRLGEFELVAELAHGSRGRVFVATQPALANRPVVLKLTPLDGAEHLSLARLQHTNIVPLYSVVDDPPRNLRVLCMPYFGRATLGSLLTMLAQIAPSDRTGRHVVDAIDRSQRDPALAEVLLPLAMGAARQLLETVSYEQAMCWISACLADALQFAHERGVVHLDLKPSNVLLTADGQPMLLDFHLAREPIKPRGAVPENVGGTPPYMPAEQQAAMLALQNGQAVELAVDGRADIYALAAMLYESLGGTLPISANSPRLSRLNPQVSIGLSDIIAQGVAHRAEDRYHSALELADDLRRHLADQPLRGVANRSTAERWRKWRRRRPNAFRAAAMLAIVGVAIAIAIATLASGMRHRHEQAQLALADGRRLLQDDRNPTAAIQTFERGLNLVKVLWFQGELVGQLQDNLMAARRLHAAEQLHAVADQIRVLYVTESVPPSQLHSMVDKCLTLWKKRDAIMETGENAQLAADLKDIAIFAASLLGSDHQAALRILDETEAVFGPSAVLDHERRVHQNALGTAVTSPTTPACTAWEHYALGRALLVRGDLEHAAPHLAAARALEPAGRWANFYFGLCAIRSARHADAIEAFSVCIGSTPDRPEHFYNRALAYAASNRPDEALRDYDRALVLDPTNPAAALNRGVLHLGQKRHRLAADDLQLALKNGADPATAHYDLALVCIAEHDSLGAREHAKLALASDPNHSQARKMLDTLQP